MQSDQIKVFEVPSSPRRTTLATFLTLLLIVLGVVLWMVGPYLLAVTMGGILALLSYPFFLRLKRHSIKSNIAALLITLGVVLLVIIPISLFVTVVVKQGIAIGQTLASNENFSFHSVIDKVSKWRPIETVMGSPEALERQARTWIQGASKTVTTGVLGVAAYVPSILLQLALTSIACFFFLVDGKKFLSWTANKIPLDSDVRYKVVTSFKDTAISVIWATLAAAGAQSMVMFIGYILLGVPAAFLAAGATFIFAWIPMLGSVPVWVAGVIYLYSQGFVLKAVLMTAVGLIAGVIDNFVRPLVLKGRSKMHPLVSLVAIFGGIGMFGIMGVFIGPILAAIVISLLQIWPAVGQRFGLLPASLPKAKTKPIEPSTQLSS